MWTWPREPSTVTVCLVARRTWDAVLYAHGRRYSAGADAILDKADFVVKRFLPLLFFSSFSLDLTAFYQRLPVVTQYRMVGMFEIRKDIEWVGCGLYQISTKPSIRLPTGWSRVPRLVKELTTIYGFRRFITVFSTFRHSSLARLIQSIFYFFTSLSFFFFFLSLSLSLFIFFKRPDQLWGLSDGYLR